MSVTAAHRAAGVGVDPALREKDDFYPTPTAAVKALLAVESFTGAIWEPACGNGAISAVLAAAGHEVINTDLVDRGYGVARVDFLMEWRALAPNIITNPPFKMVSPFIERSVMLTTGKVALLLRLACLEGSQRRALFDRTPLARVWVFSRRIMMYRGGNDTGRAGMFAFAWFVWEHGFEGKPTLGWL